mgnify:CR=1 FL=1
MAEGVNALRQLDDAGTAVVAVDHPRPASIRTPERSRAARCAPS